MTKIAITTKTSDQIDAAFDAVFKDIQPVRNATRPTLDQRLEPFRKAVMKQRRRGLSWKQIAAAMSDPRIGEKFSAKSLWTVFGKQPKRSAPAAPAAAASPRQRLFLDPVTGKPITPAVS
jgi:hypothetical protein